MKGTRRRQKILAVLAAPAVCLLLFYGAQRFWAHRDGYFTPDYPRFTLSENTAHETIFLQTGLGRSAVDHLLESGDFETVLKTQDAFFSQPQSTCTSLLGWFTREDRRTDSSSIPLVDLQPGDILVTLSTHTAGWRHGHVGLVIDQNTVLESTVLGSNSTLVSTTHWTTYSNYAVLRIKDVTPDLQQQVVNFSLEHLTDVPYRLLSGFLGPKAPSPNVPWFGLHCSYLVWYAWNRFGYDLDSDGGRLVTAHDLLHSDLLEVVQIWGMDPRTFLS